MSAGKITLAALLLAASACKTGASLGGAAVKISASSWPRADALFHKDPRWLGGDGAFSVDLGGDRTLWLFGDSFIATSAANKRAESKMVRNSIAVQTGRDPAAAAIVFHWRQAGGAPASFFAEDGEAWFWPRHGLRVKTGLLLVLSWLVRDDDPESLGFRAAGWEARWVKDLDQPPPRWTLDKVAVPQVAFALVGGVSLLAEGEHVYAYCVREPDSHDVVLLRWSRAKVEQADLLEPAWWMGSARGWVPHAALGDRRPAVLLSGATGFSVSRPKALGGAYAYVQTDGFGAADLVVRTAPRPEGPWSTPQKVYRPPESDRGGKVIVYAGKAHPQLTGADLVATYAANSLDFSQLVRDATLYYPRMVRITIE